MFKFIFDETGAKSEKDKENELGLVAGFILTDKKIEDSLMKGVEQIIQEYNLRELPKIHMSAIRDKEKKIEIQEKIFSLLNKLNIVWTYGSTHIKTFKEKQFYKNKEELSQKQKKSIDKSNANWPIAKFYEECLFKTLTNVMDYKRIYCNTNTDEIIEMISDPLDESIKKSFEHFIEKTIKPTTEYTEYCGYDKEKKEKIPLFYIKATISNKDGSPYIVSLPKYKIECKDSNLTFVADVLAYKTIEILKKNFLSENEINNLKIMAGHPCEYLFIYEKDIDKIFKDI